MPKEVLEAPQVMFTPCSSRMRRMVSKVTSAIMDTRTPRIVEAVKAADVFLNHDDWGMAWIAAHRARQAAEQAAAV